ncbi:MAG: helix-turn-helix domain-containing protein [Oscillospiraceae bacterium]
MNNSKTVISVKDYGKIDICLKELMESRNITRNSLAKAANTRFEVIDKWYNNNVEKLDLDVLARICYVLDCSPEEIVKYNDCK